MDALLAQAGSDKSRILMMQIFLKDIKEFAKMNAVYDTWVPPGQSTSLPRREVLRRADSRSARGVSAASPRATVQAALADDSWLIEVVCVAAAAPISAAL